MNPDGKSLVLLYSEPNFLSIYILENLLANNCFVNVVTSDVKGWAEKTSHIVARNKFSIGAHDTFQKNVAYGYIIFCSGFLNKTAVGDDIKKFLKTVGFQNTKTFVVLPKETYGVLGVEGLQISDNIGIIYIGDLLGPRIDLTSNLKLPRYLNDMMGERSFSMPVGELFYPVFVSDAAKQIVKWLFAFGPYGKEILLLGAEISSNVFWQINTKLLGDIKYISLPNAPTDKLPRNIEISRMNRDVNYSLTETYKWISSRPLKYVRQKNPPLKKTNKQTIGKPSGKRMKLILVPLLIVFLLPILNLIVSGVLTYFAYREFRVGHDDVALNLFYSNKIVSNVGLYESKALKYIPLIGQIYKETEYTSYVFKNTSDVAISAIPLIKKGKTLFSSMLGNSPYSVAGLLSDSDEELGQIYTSISTLEEKTITGKGDGSIVAKMILSKIDFETYKNLVSQMTIIVEKLPDILGSEKSKTYLVLFENNMELRPTGGFIGSYGLLTFGNGRLSDFVISDVYSADGQLNGHVEPPAPIKQYLGEANWWLRDSNWDPDFPTSAKRAEWFLDKEMDKQVDGVVSIDLHPIKDFLEVSGSIFLSDYNMDITPDNLYEKVQSEVQDNFFPGTHKKASFLTALSRTILDEIGNLSSSQKISVLKLIYKSLDQRHVQLFLHATDVQKSISALNWDGAVFIPSCDGNCFSDLAGIVEANVGVNKSNYFVKRSAEVDINIKGGEINKILTLTLQNSANTDLGASGRYKSYVRLLVPENSTNIKVTSTFGQNYQVLTPEITDSKGRKEIGIITEVLGGESKKLIFSWTNKTDNVLSQYGFYFRKQAGIDGFPVSIKVTTPIKILGSNPVFTSQCSKTPPNAPLQGEYEYCYNATLVRDLFARMLF